MPKELQSDLVSKAGRGDSFRPGQAWRAPGGALYRVVSHDGSDLTKPMQAVLRAGAYGEGKKMLRDWEAVDGWLLVPEAEVHDALTRPPADFEIERSRVHAYLSRSVHYDWVSVSKRDLIPRDACSIVLCGKSGREPANARCLAFVKVKNGRFRWFGITSSLHEPVELLGVVGFVPVADAAALLFAEPAESGR